MINAAALQSIRTVSYTHLRAVRLWSSVPAEHRARMQRFSEHAPLILAAAAGQPVRFATVILAFLRSVQWLSLIHIY